MDELEAHLQAAAADLHARTDAIARTETALLDVRAGSAHRGHSHWMPRIVAAAGIAAAVVGGVVILRPHDSAPSISRSSASERAPTTVFAIPTTAPSATTTVPPASATVTTEPTAASTDSSSTPFTRCDYTDPGKYPISVGRALTCPDGTAVEVTGQFIRDQDGVAWLCDQIAGSDTRPCTGQGLQVIGEPTAVGGTYSGLKQGNTLVVDSAVVYIPSATPSGPVITGVTRSTIPEALVSGVVRFDGSCVRLVTGATSQVVVWPAGTRWDDDRREIVLPDGLAISDGARIDGSGGYSSVDNVPDVGPDVIDALTACLPVGLVPTSPDTVVIAFPQSVVNPTPVVPVTPTP